MPEAAVQAYFGAGEAQFKAAAGDLRPPPLLSSAVAGQMFWIR